LLCVISSTPQGSGGSNRSPLDLSYK